MAPTYRSVGGFFSAYSYYFPVIWLAIWIMLIVVSRYAHYQVAAHRDPTDTWKRWSLLPIYELGLFIKQLAIILYCALIVTLDWPLESVHSDAGFSLGAKLFAIIFVFWVALCNSVTVVICFCRPQCGSKTVRTAVIAYTVLVLVATFLTWGEVAGTASSEQLPLAWGPSFLSNSASFLRTNTSKPRQALWAMTFWVATFVCVFLLVCMVLMARGRLTPRMPRLFIAEAFLWAAELWLVSLSDLLENSIGFQPMFLCAAVSTVFRYWYMVIDSRFWSQLSLDGNVAQANLNQLEQPLLGRICFELSHVRKATQCSTTRAPHVHWASIKFGKRIGAGSMGNVHKGIIGHELVAVKSMICDDLGVDEVHKLCHEIEVSWQLALACDKIVHNLGFSINPPFVSLIMDYHPRGSLFDLFQNFGHTLTMLERLELACDVVEVLAVIHNLGFVHCDIKSLNYLVDDSKPGRIHAKLADFGETLFISEVGMNQDPKPCSVLWAAPEILLEHEASSRGGSNGRFRLGSRTGTRMNEERASPGRLSQGEEQRLAVEAFATDTYSATVVIWECLTCREPYMEMKIDKLAQSVIEGLRPDLGVMQATFRVASVPDAITQDVIELLELGWTHAPYNRASSSEMALRMMRVREHVMEIFAEPPRSIGELRRTTVSGFTDIEREKSIASTFSEPRDEKRCSEISIQSDTRHESSEQDMDDRHTS